MSFPSFTAAEAAQRSTAVAEQKLFEQHKLAERNISMAVGDAIATGKTLVKIKRADLKAAHPRTIKALEAAGYKIELRFLGDTGISW